MKSACCPSCSQGPSLIVCFAHLLVYVLLPSLYSSFLLKLSPTFIHSSQSTLPTGSLTFIPSHYNIQLPLHFASAYYLSLSGLTFTHCQLITSFPMVIVISRQNYSRLGPSISQSFLYWVLQAVTATPGLGQISALLVIKVILNQFSIPMPFVAP